MSSEAAAPRPRLVPAGDLTLVVEFGDVIDPLVNQRVHRLAAAIGEARLDGIVDLIPTYRSLLVYYDPLRLPLAKLTSTILALDRRQADGPAAPGRIVEMPTCYGGEFGPDLEAVAAHARLSADEVVSIHTSADYLVYMMGFSPGFTYLGGMSPRIATPRLKTPRTRIPAGSVGIAQEQTGIYPTESPGGWQLIGRTPVPLFDPRREPPTAVEPGDRIRFVAIDADRYRQVEAAVAAGRFTLTVHRAATGG